MKNLDHTGYQNCEENEPIVIPNYKTWSHERDETPRDTWYLSINYAHPPGYQARVTQEDIFTPGFDTHFHKIGGLCGLNSIGAQIAGVLLSSWVVPRCSLLVVHCKWSRQETQQETYLRLFNSLALGRSECDPKNVIFNLFSLIGIFRNSYNIALQWMPQDLTDDKSTLVHVMAWCCQATNHYLSQCWPRSLTPYDVTRPQWVEFKSVKWYWSTRCRCFLG